MEVFTSGSPTSRQRQTRLPRALRGILSARLSRKSFSSDEFKGGEPETAGSAVEATAEAGPFDISLLVSRRARLAAALARAGVEDSAVAAVLAGGGAATPEDLGL